MAPHGGGREGGLYRTFATFHPVDKISQNFVDKRKIEKYNYFADKLFFIFAIVFE